MLMRSSSKSSSIGGVLPRVDPVRLHERRRLAGRRVVDADELRQRMVAEDLDVLAGDPAGADDAYSVLGHCSPPQGPRYATTSISTMIPSRLLPTVVRTGFGSGKYSA